MTTIRVKASPDAKKQSITQISAGKLAVSVREPAENNVANQKIMDLVAEYCQIPRKKLRMIAGHKRPNKTIRVLE